MENPENIYLIGMMGAGKSSVGQILAKTLGMRFVDTDRWIEDGEGVSIAEIFKTKGEAHFRELEKNCLLELGKRTVVATGGGMGAEPFFWEVTRGITVWLEASLQTLKGRLQDDGERPLTKGLDTLIKVREPRYKRADYHIQTDSLDPSSVADAILGKIGFNRV